MKPKVRKEAEARLSEEDKKRLKAGRRRAKSEGWGDQIVGPQDIHALGQGCYFDARFADHAVAFFEQGLTHATGKWAGQPFTLQPWQRERIIRPLFGWRRSNGTRRYRSAFVFVAKKNGKSTLCGGLILYQLIAEPDPINLERSEPAQEIYAASTSREVASIIFRESKKLAEASRAINKRVTVANQTRRIVYAETGSFFRVLPHKASSAEGMIAGGVYLDEIHAMRSRELYAALRWSGASRAQPLVVEITTAGIDQPSLWRDRHRYSQRVAAGEHVDTSHLVALYEADPDAELDDLAQLRKANPSLGVTIDEAELVEQARQVQGEGPAAIAEFKRYRMNLAVGAEQGWLSPEQWDKGQVPFDPLDLAERPCLAGLDLAKVSDFTALCLLWPPDEEADEIRWRAALWFWLPRAAVKERTQSGDTSYQSWADEGLIEVTHGDTTDHQIVRRRINEIAEKFTVQKIGIDRGFEGWQFCQDLFNDDELPAVGVGQGWRSQDVPMQRIEALVRDGHLNAGGHPIMRWMIGNAIAKRVGSNENMHLDRARATDKIDGVAALLNAMYLAEVVAEPEPEYDYCPLV